MDIPVSQLAVTKYENKKGDKKIQIILSENLFQKLICADSDLLNIINMKAQK